MKRIGIIGGGASGLMAGCFAGGEGKEVVLFEKQKKIGRKILISGNGRCNISNINLDPSRYHGTNPKFVNNVFSRFGLEETREFFKSIGIPFAEGKDGKFYPASFQASTVTNILEYELGRRGVDINLHRRIDRIISRGGSFELTTAGGETRVFDSVILSAGSCAYSPAGASRSGYELASSLNHRIIECFPTLLPINIAEKSIRKMQGIKWDCGVRVVLDNKILCSAQGELLFTDYGISGPAALDISRSVNENVLRGKIPDIVVDFFPDYPERELMDFVSIVLADPSRKLAFSLNGIVKDRMPEVFLENAGFDRDVKVGNLKKEEVKKLVVTLKNFKLTPGSPRDFKEAVVAAGGVDVGQINPTTMESRIVKNFFITGELLDIDGDSGGYNLQFAWSTGALAGMAQ